MDFRGVHDLDERFSRQWSPFLDGFPFAAMALEAELRNISAGDIEVALRNVSRLTRHYPVVDWALTAVFLTTSRVERPQLYVNLPGFHDVARSLKESLSDNPGLACFSDRRIARFRANQVLHKLCTAGQAYPKVMRQIAAVGAAKAVTDRDLMAQLDQSFSRNYDRLKQFIISQNIRAFVAAGDMKPHERLICHAAQELGRPYLVLAHGYVSDPGLVSVAPIRADALVLWTEQQRSLIADVLPERIEDLMSFGFPARVKVPVRQPGDRVVFAWEPLGRMGKRDTHAKCLAALSGICRAARLEPVFRPHPKDRHDAEIIADIEATGFSLDHMELQESLATARCVVSSNSTVLTEAAAAGVPAYQVEELAEFRFEGSQLISATEFRPGDAPVSLAADQFLPFDAEAFAVEIRRRTGLDD
ncbi:hypothetical protein QTA57_15655 [Fontisubflavum oceani]|uniref:hypothetical protein n=1 Tax=Fontisubflavum oceani TaxID=2978973 RepID=UPI0025B5635A|nr:hypothetical protein [Fontisubflavum oceani]WJY21193.1 hypothetical protein QTA57_15655 [Fontisubflavum oceani]